jgi:Protein of unknown function (DUF3551)
MPRLSLLLLSLIAAALFGEIQSASAQSPTSYPWCAKYYESWNFSSLSCYYTSYEQCRTTMSGIGGVCIHSPYYRGAAPSARVTPRLRRH